MKDRIDILVVDDDADLAQLVAHFLTKARFGVRLARSGQSALRLFAEHRPNLILMDIGLEDANGIELCRRFRSLADVPVIFLTSHTDEVDQLMGFASGADDFVAKPVSERLLLARIEAVLRRHHFVDPESAVLSAGVVTLNALERTVTLRDQPIELTHLEFEFLRLLMEGPRQVFTRAIIAEQVWGSSWVDDHAIDVLVSRLRLKFTERGGPNVVDTVRGVGYRLARTL